MANPLKAYLTLTGTTGTAFAEQLGVSPGFLSRLMSGEREADASMLAAIQSATGGQVTPDMWVKWWRKASRERASC